jgi:hypothetical protein
MSKKTRLFKNTPNNYTIKNNNLSLNIKPSLKIINQNSFLYASKFYDNKDKLLLFTKKIKNKKTKKCILKNIKWFGNYKVAKSYKTNNTKLYRWIITQPTFLLNINLKNKKYFKYLFLNNTKAKLISAITIPNIKEIKYTHKYLNMNTNERAYYEFCFVFGYIDIEEQYEFMKFLQYLLEEKLIIMNRRNGISIINKLLLKINYYKLIHLISNHKNNNRLSFYQLDKHAVLNVCKLVKNNNIQISGLFQPNVKSIWFPDFIIYKMNIEETILFNPKYNLKFDKFIE